MDKVGVFLNELGTPAVVFPTPEALQHKTLEQIVAAAVPAGKPFALVNREDLPLDVPQEYWQVSEADLMDGVGVSHDYD